MASIGRNTVSNIPPPPASLVGGGSLTAADLDFTARDEAYKRRAIDLTPPPPAYESPPSDASQNTSQDSNSFLGNVANAILTSGGQSLPGPGSEFIGGNLGDFTKEFEKEVKKWSPPDPNLPPIAPLTPFEKRLKEEQQIQDATQDAHSVALFQLMRDDKDFDNQIVKDFDSMPAYSFQQVYGPKIYDNLVALTVGGQDVKKHANASRDPIEHMRDIGVQFIAGVPELLGGLTALGTKLVGDSPLGTPMNTVASALGVEGKATDRLAAGIAGYSQDAADFVLQGESYPGKELRYADALRAEIDSAQQEHEFTKNIRKDGWLLANLRDIGASFVHGTERLGKDKSRITELVARSGSSFLLAGPETKLLAAGGKAALGLEAATTTGFRASLVDALAFPTAVGSMEAGDAFSSTINQAMDIPHETLMLNNLEYRKLIEAGWTEKGAKTQLAVEGGMDAAKIAFVEGALSSAAFHTKGFETNPFKRMSLRQAAAEVPLNIAKEVPEEAVQGFGGQFATNIGVQNVDPEQRALEDTGVATVQGAAAGGGTPIGLQGTKLAARTAGKVVAAPFVLAGKTLIKNAERVIAKGQAAEPVSTENLTPAMSNAAAQAPALAESLKALVPATEQIKPETTTETAPPLQAETTPELSLRDVLQSQGPQDGQAPVSTAEPATKTEAETQAPVPIESVKEITPEETTETAQNFISKVETAAALQPDDLVVLTPTLIGKFRESVATTPEKVPTRFDAMTVMAKVIEDPKAAEEDKVAAAMFITNIINENKALFENKPAFLNDAPQDHPTVKAFDAYEKIVTSMERNPAVAKALKWGQNELTMSDRDLSETDLASPEGQTLINNLVNVATHAPHKLNENLANQVLTLSQEDKATSVLTPEKRKALQAATSMLAGPREYARNNAGTTEEAAAAETTTTPPASSTGSTSSTDSTEESGLDIVGRQIETEGGARGYKRSLKDHVAEINQAIKSGNVAEIKTRIKKLALFALSQRNKLEAMQQSIDGKGSTDPQSLGRVPYEAFDGKKMRPADGVFEVWFNTKAASSVDAAQRIHQAATLLTNQANHYIDMFPEVGIQKATVPDLRLPGSQAVGGSSTTSQQAVPTPATTSEVTATGQLELPLSPATGQAPAATDTTAATTQTSTPAGGKPQFSVEQIQDKTTFPDARLKHGIGIIKGLKNPTVNNLATLAALEAEVERRKPKAKTKTKKVVSQIDRLVRKAIGKIGKPKSRPLNLFQFLASKTQGGIRDESGGLAAMGLTKKFIPGMGRLIRAKGKTLDEAREAVAEAGYFDEQYGSPEEAMAKSTPDDLLKLISQEAGGQPAYSQRMDADVQFEWLEYEQRQKAREAYDNLLSEVDATREELGLGPLRDNVLVRAAELVSEGHAPDVALDMALEEDLQATLEQDEMENDIFKNPGFPLFFEAESEGQDTGTSTGSVPVVGQTGNTGGQPGTGSQVPGTGQRVPSSSSNEAEETFVNIWAGSDENTELSNLALRPFTYEGRKYQSVEHAYQSNKSGEFDQATYDKYTGKPKQKIPGKLAKIDMGYNIKLMEKLIQASFDQNPEAMKALLATGKATLTHKQNKPGWHAKDIWVDEFPRILMKIREDLAKAKSAKPAEAETKPAETGKGLRVIITGGLKYADKDAVFAALDRLHKKSGISAIIHQGARGADSLASQWAQANGVEEIVVRPDWKTHGRTAWQQANQSAVDNYQANAVVAFPGDRGTNDMLDRVSKAGLKVWQPGTAPIGPAESRITPKQAEKLTKEQFEETLARINEKPIDTWTDEDHATFDVLEREAIRRENANTIADDFVDTLEVGETPTTDTKTAHPDLVTVGEDKRNWFWRSFKLPKVVTSRLTLLDRPLAKLHALLGSVKSLNEFLAEARITRYSLTPSDLDAQQRLLKLGQDALKHMHASLTTALNTKPFKNDDRTLLQRLQDGVEQSLRTRDNRILNLLEIKGDNYRYNPQLIQAAMLGALDWVMNIGDRVIPVDVKAVAETMGIDQAYAYRYLEVFQDGISRDMAVRTLGDNILKFMGVQTNRDEKEDFTKGIREAIAKEMLVALEKVGLLQTGIETMPEITKKEFGRVWFNRRPESIQNLITQLHRTHTLLRDVSLVNAEQDGYSVGVPITDIDESQLRQNLVTNTTQQKEALSVGQTTPYFLDQIQLNLMQAMDEEGFVTLMSGFPYSDGDLNKDHNQMGYNKNHWKSIQGRQRGLRATYRNIQKQIALMDNYAKTNGIPITEVPVYYKHHINRLGRPQMDGLSNPQTDKTARHMFLPTKSVLDLSKPGSRSFRQFMKTIAQGIGVKTERKLGDDAINEAMARTMETNGDLRPLVEAFKVWLQGDQQNIQGTTYKLMQDMGPAKLTDHMIHAVMAVARYGNARDAGEDLTKFVNMNPLEADGKTNGVINALMMSVKEITADWLKTVAKGGVFFGHLGKTLNQHYLEDSDDIYQADANLMAINMSNLLKRLGNQKDKATYGQMQRMRRLLASFSDDVNFNPDGELEIKRGLAKSPQTKSVYGAGSKSLAVTIANDLIDLLYERMTEEIKTGTLSGDLIYGKGGDATMFADLRALVSNIPTYNSETKEWDLEVESTHLDPNPKEFTLTDRQFDTLVANVQAFLVGPLQKAIDQNVNRHVKEVNGAVQRATQIQSIFSKALYVDTIINAIAEKKANPEQSDYNKGEFSLSENEMTKIRKLIKKFSPFIDTGTQRYMMNGGETTNLFEKTVKEVNGQPVVVNLPTSLSRTLDGQIDTPVYIYGATTAGVRATPTLNVGSGDGQMMLNFLVDNPDIARRVLHVFDGLYLPADLIETGSQAINKAVYNTWTKNENPIRAVLDSYVAFMRNSPVDTLFPGTVRAPHQRQALLELASVVSGKPIEKLTNKDVEGSYGVNIAMKGLVNTLTDLADITDINRQIYTEFDLSVDQMASGETPHVHEGSIKVDITDPALFYDQMATAMKKRFDELYAERVKSRTKTAAVERPAAVTRVYNAVETFLRSHATVDDRTGAQVVNVRQLRNLPGQNEVMTAAIENLAKDNYLLVFGDPVQLDQWESLNNSRYQENSNQNRFGKIDPIARIITISNIAPETTFHELIHAATIAKVMGYYTKSDKLSAADHDAVGRIEDLMNQWLSLDLTTEDEATTEAAALAESAIVENQEKADLATKAGNPELAAQHNAIALNEFMAWVLSNQNLAKVAEKTTVNPVLALIGKALQTLKDLIWGKNKAPEVADTLLSQLQFNTQMLMAKPTPVELLKQEALNVMLYQSTAFGQNDRITAIREGIANKIISWLAEPATNVPAYATQAQRERENQTQIARRNRELIGIRAQVHAMVTEFELQFPDISNMQGSSTFQAIQTILMTDMKINPNVMTRLEELYDHTISKLTKENFRTNNDPNDVVDDAQAQEKFEALHGLKAFHVDQYGRTSFMSSFLALAMTSETFRNVLSNMEKPKAEINTQGGVDALLENTTNSMINRVSMALSGEQSTSENITDALDDLTSKLIENIGNQKNYIDTQANGFINGADRYVADKIQSLSGKVVDASNRVLSSSGSRIVRTGARAVRLAATVVNEQAAQDALLTAIGAVNKIEGWDETRAFLNDLVGRNKTNANVWDLISKVRAIVSQTRQRYRDRLPIAIAKKFSRVIKTEEWTALYKGLGSSDLSTLFDTHGVEGAVEIATSTRVLNRETNALETTIRGYEGARADKVIQKAKQLAHQMMTGQYGGVSGNEISFLKNALAVARLFNEREYQSTLANPQLEGDVDRLTTLYALAYLSAEDKAMIQELSQNELDGLKFVSHYLAGLRKNEMAKVTAGNSRLGMPNYRKGYIPSEKQNEGTLIIANDNQQAYYTKLGYVKVADYEGSSADRTRIARAYYFSPVSGTSPFRQGIMQTVHYTAMGIDPQTGYMTDQLTAGRIDNPQVVDLVKRLIPRQRQTTEHLLPVFDNLTGEVVAYERSSDPLKITGIDRSTHLAKMMAAWKGRQVEEAFAPELNKTLVDELKKTWDKAVQDGKTNQFVNVMVPNGDPVLEDAVKLIPNYTRDYITQVFGKDRFMVRRDLELQALGDRQASVGDAFTANTRWKKPVQERFEKMALGLFATAPFVKLLGDNQAYTSLVRSEKLLHEFVTNAKNTIVIKSVVVPVANILSNFGQLLTRGVPLRTIIREFPKKVMEINTYIKARNKEIELEAELQAAQGEKNDKEIRKLESRIAALNDSYKRLSIYPLIQGGQFASISQGQVTAEDLALAESKWSNYMGTLFNKLPDNGLRTTAKYGMVAKDTALFRALAASVQYGDFVAKAILYDDLTIRQDMKSDEAIAMVGEAFVNYNVLAGRGRDWYEKSGLLWFYNFKLRSVKEAAYLLRHHPLRSLLSMTLPGLSDLDSPLDSNVISLGVDGKLDWSMGPGMGFNAWTMNPVVNLVN